MSRRKMSGHKMFAYDGCYIDGIDLHVKAEPGERGEKPTPFLTLKVRLTEEDVREKLQPQIDAFLKALDKRRSAA